MAALYFFVGVIIFIVVDGIADPFIKGSLYSIAADHTFAAVNASYREILIIRWIGRVIKLILFAISAYYLAMVSMRPLRRSLDRQRRFVAMVSHQLRTPLTVMKTSSEIALRSPEAFTPERCKGLVESTLEEVDRLIEMVNFLLTYSKFEHRETKLVMGPTSLVTVADQVVEFMQPDSNKKQVTLALTAIGDPWIRGNATGLRELIMNLVKNAITYTPPGGRVEVRLSETAGQRVILAVVDTGIGISSDEQEKIFDPFFRGKRSIGGAFGGSGIGLSVVKEIAVLHRADIELESTEGVGTEIRIIFKALYPGKK